MRLPLRELRVLRVRLPLRELRVCDGLRAPVGADLPGVEGRAAGAAHAVRTVHLADRPEVRDVFALPPGVGGEAAVVVLRAEGDFERPGGEVDAVLSIERDGAGVHAQKPRDRRAGECAAPFQIVVRFGGEFRRVEAGRFGAEIEEDAATSAERLLAHQQVDARGAGFGLRGVERPLVALEEDHARSGGRISAEGGEQEVARVGDAVRRGGNEARQRLHVGSGNVPAELHRG